MTPDRIEELSKKKKLAELSMPDREEADNATLNAKVSPTEVMDAGYDIPFMSMPDREERFQPEKPIAKYEETDNPDGVDNSRMIADIVTGATPTLINFLTGASAAHTNRGFDRANSYMKNRATQEIPTKANTTLVDDNGEPKITMYEDAIGKNAWKAKKNGADSSGQASDSNFFNIQPPNGRTFMARFNSQDKKFYGADGSPVDIPAGSVKNPVSEKLIKGKTMGGGDSTVAYNQYSTSQPLKPLTKNPGRGDVTGQTAQAYDENIKSASKAKDKAYEPSKNLSTLDAILKDPNALKNPSVFATNFGSLMRVSVGEKRLSDPEQVLYEGGRYKTWKQQAENYASGKIKGEIPQNVINDYLALVNDAKMKLNSEIKSAYGVYANPEASTGKRMREDQARASGKNPVKTEAIKVNNDREIKLINEAASHIKDPSIRKKYIDKKMSELNK